LSTVNQFLLQSRWPKWRAIHRWLHQYTRTGIQSNIKGLNSLIGNRWYSTSVSC